MSQHREAAALAGAAVEVEAEPLAADRQLDVLDRGWTPQVPERQAVRAHHRYLSSGWDAAAARTRRSALSAAFTTRTSTADVTITATKLSAASSLDVTSTVSSTRGSGGRLALIVRTVGRFSAADRTKCATFSSLE